MSIKVDYKTYIDAPILITGQGRSYSMREPEESVSSLSGQAFNLYEESRHSELRSNLRQAEQDRVLKEARARIGSLYASIQGFDPPQVDNILLEKTARSPQPEDLSLEADRESNTSASHTLLVHWPAAGRSISSEDFNPVEEVSLADGEHEFVMVIDGEEHTLSVSVNNTPGAEVDTQEELLRKLAVEVSMRDSRVAARVEYGETDAYDPSPRSQPMDRTATLKVYSTSDGEGVEFYFEDAEDGSLVSEYGLDSARVERSTFWEQEGSTRTQSGNLISLDSGHVTGQIFDSTSGVVDVPVDYATRTVTEGMNQIIGQYNDLVNYLDSHSDVLRPSLLDRVTRPLQERALMLSSLGLGTNAKGIMKTKPSFETNLQYDYGSAREVLLDQGGWTQNLATKLGQILAMEEDAFALPLSGGSLMEDRRRAWTLVDNLSAGIVSGYI